MNHYYWEAAALGVISTLAFVAFGAWMFGG